jgi:hypothetical protein
MKAPSRNCVRVIINAYSMFFAFRRRDSISIILSQLALPTLDTVLANGVFLLER